MRTKSMNTKVLSRTGTTVALALFLGVAGCKSSSPAQAPNVINTAAATASTGTGVDPAAVNMAPVNGAAPAPAQGQVMGARSVYSGTQSGEEYPPQQAAPQQPPPGETAPANPDDYGPNQQYAAGDQGSYDSQADAGEDALYADQPPPPLPVYEQPVVDDPNYIWTPGYWSFGPGGYFWVPGAWVAPPFMGALWTPGYWGYGGSRYLFHRGYWGPYVGFYGGINYGFGYTGYGYSGGYWNGNNFYYNRSVNRINPGIRNFYEHPVESRGGYSRVSYNGGRGGLTVRPRPAEMAAMRQQRVPAMRTQIDAVRSAGQNRQQFFNQNKGRPAVAAAARPYQANRVAAPAAMQHVQQQNQQRLQQMNGQHPQQMNGRPQPGNQPQGNQQREQQQRPQQPTGAERGGPQNRMQQPNQVQQNRGAQNEQMQRQQPQVNQQRNEQNTQRPQQQQRPQEMERQQQVQQQQRQQQMQVQQRQQQQVNQQREQQQQQQQRQMQQRPQVQARPQMQQQRPQQQQQPRPQMQQAHPQPQPQRAAPPRGGGEEHHR
ncbi:YXWGXW repeat-containing protein [Granulicella sp. WH15]|uniref:YXWGXW repeat-containing protein n=1 Tax=Granulicella sp. WH15 TaxID=2602070 RepID=UPI0013A543AE|nr:YXWGXW repeat-containing protein [Granulicella sp. WH15]